MEYKTYDSQTGEHNFQELLKNIGSPVIVQTLSSHMSTLKVPGTLTDVNLIDNADNVSGGQGLLQEVGINQNSSNDSHVIVAEPINPTTVLEFEASFQSEHSQPQTGHASSTPKKRNRNRKNKSRLTGTPTTSNNIADEDVINITDTSINNCSSSEIFHKQTNVNIASQGLPRFYSLGSEVIVVMEPNTSFCFTGKLKVRVLSGAIEAYGALFTKQTEPVDIYSPKGHSYVALRTSSKYLEALGPDIWTYLLAEGVNASTDMELKNDIDHCEPGTAVIVLMNLENKLTKFLNAFFPFKIFPRIDVSANYSWTDPRRAEVVLQSDLYFGTQMCKQISMNPQVISEVTEKMLSKHHSGEWSCTLIAGGKGVGKSTSARYLINSLLPTTGRVVLLDLDPGQTECTPAGCVSYSLIQSPLMGPNFTHLKIPVYQLYLGDVNVSRCITRYIEAVKKLFDRLSNCPTLSRLPIVVNTMGFCKGIGWDILVFIIKLVRPSLVLQITSKTPKNNFNDLLTSEIIDRQQLAWGAWSRNIIDWNKPCSYELLVTPSDAETKPNSSVEMWNMQPYQHRELVWLSYLSEIAQYNNMSHRYTVYPSINAAIPYVVSFSSLYIALPQNYVPATHVFAVTNGNIVALCGFDNDSTDSRTDSQRPRILIRPPLSACYGFGIVRGVDVAKEELYINTPLPLSMMQYVNCLVGCIPLPASLLNVHQDGAPYVGGSVDLPTSREHRRGYFRFRNRNNN